MFGGSLRDNIDPLRLYTDAAVQVGRVMRGVVLACVRDATRVESCGGLCACVRDATRVESRAAFAFNCHTLTLCQEALALAGLAGRDIGGAVATGGGGWSQGEKQLVGAGAGGGAAAAAAVVVRVRLTRHCRCAWPACCSRSLSCCLWTRCAVVTCCV